MPERGGERSRNSGRKTNDRRDSDKKPRSNGRFSREDSNNDSKRSYSGPKKSFSGRSNEDSSFDRNKRPARKSNSGFKKEGGFGDRRRPSGDRDERRSFDKGEKRFLRGDREDTRSSNSGEKRFSRGDRDEKKSYGDREKRFSRGDRDEKKSYGDREKRFTRGDRDEKKSYGDREKRFSRDDRDDKRSSDRGDKRFSRGDRDEKRSYNKSDKPFSRDDRDDKRGFEKKERGFSGSNRDDRGSKRPDKRFSKDDRSDRKDYKRDNPEDKKRPRTRKLNEKDQEMLGDWRRERPESEFHKRADKFKEIESITEEVRLNKYLANSGLCSRRDADEYILNGAVTINGVEAKELGSRVQPGDEVRFKGRLILPEKPVYILMNKPKDCITSADDPEGRRTVLDIIGDHIPQRIFPVGRLDRNTTGVLLLTNDGDLSQKLTHPSFGVHKIYKAELNKPMTKADLDKLAEGVELEDGFIKPDEVAYVDESRLVVGIEIHSGKNHIVHRMFNSLGYLIEKLDRVTFAGLSKDGLKRGDIRHLTEKELMTLRKESGKKSKN